MFAWSQHHLEILFFVNHASMLRLLKNPFLKLARASMLLNLAKRSIQTCENQHLLIAREENITKSHTQMTAPDSPIFTSSWPNPTLLSHTRSTRPGVSIKVLHSYQGGEYPDKAFTLYLKQQGMEQKLTVHSTPTYNGVAKHQNQTIVEHIHALLHASSLPKFLWKEAAHHVVWLMNHTTTKAVDGKTPYEAVFEKKLDLCDVCEWGEKVWIRVEGGDKFGGHVHGL